MRFTRRIQKDNSAIQGVQSFSVEELLLFAQKQLSLAEEVYAVYEAGPLGYMLYRRLRELGIRAYVSAPSAAGGPPPPDGPRQQPSPVHKP
jgi:hypothetical protein